MSVNFGAISALAGTTAENTQSFMNAFIQLLVF